MHRIGQFAPEFRLSTMFANIRSVVIAVLLSHLTLCAHAQKVLTVAAYPAVDSIIKAALPAWEKKHPGVQVKVISRAYADHHTAMTTALSTSSKPPDVMVLESSYVARFATGGGLEDLGAPPYNLNESKHLRLATRRIAHKKNIDIPNKTIISLPL